MLMIACIVPERRAWPKLVTFLHSLITSYNIPHIIHVLRAPRKLHASTSACGHCATQGRTLQSACTNVPVRRDWHKFITEV